LNRDTSTLNILRIHLPEWRDSLAVNQEIRRALRSGRTQIHLTGARGDRLLLNGIDGPYAGRIRIDGDVGTELARDLDAENLFVVVNGSAGAGAGMGMKAGTLCVTGPCGALLGSRMQGGTIWALGSVGTRAGHRALGGTIRTAGATGALTLDRHCGGQCVTIGADDPNTLELGTILKEIAAWPAG
jgi:glutamate synthase domain-containing protein 3